MEREDFIAMFTAIAESFDTASLAAVVVDMLQETYNDGYRDGLAGVEPKPDAL